LVWGGQQHTLSASESAGRSTKVTAAVLALCVFAPVAMAVPAACSHAQTGLTFQAALTLNDHFGRLRTWCRLLPRTNTWKGEAPHLGTIFALSAGPKPTTPTNRALPPTRAKADVPCATEIMHQLPRQWLSRSS